MNNTTNTISKLPPNYTRNRPIGYVTSNALDNLHAAEMSWVAKQWRDFRGAEDDCEFNVIMEKTTPISKTKIWVVDRDGEDSAPMLMLPSDY